MHMGLQNGVTRYKCRGVAFVYRRSQTRVIFCLSETDLKKSNKWDSRVTNRLLGFTNINEAVN